MGNLLELESDRHDQALPATFATSRSVRIEQFTACVLGMDARHDRAHRVWSGHPIRRG